jgi:hypothetical protein
MALDELFDVVLERVLAPACDLVGVVTVARDLDIFADLESNRVRFGRALLGRVLGRSLCVRASPGTRSL